MSEIFIPKREIEIIKPSGNVYTVHLQDIEIAPYGKEFSQAIAHLAIAVPQSAKDPKSELSDGIFSMMYKQGLRSKDFDDANTPHADAHLVFLDRYREPTNFKNLRYLSALVAVNEFILQDKATYAHKNASPFDFALELYYSNFDPKKYESTKYLSV